MRLASVRRHSALLRAAVRAAYATVSACAAIRACTAVFASIAVCVAVSCLAPSTAFCAEGGPSDSASYKEQNVVDPTQRADNSFIYDTTINTVFDQAALYQNKTIQVYGEVIGDRIVADEDQGSYWITLTETSEEDSATISVLLSAEQADQIEHYGRYGVTGTTLQVRGTFNQACMEHDGLPDIHATSSAVLSRGSEHPDEFEPREFVPGVIFVLLGVALLAGFYYARERLR